MKTLITIILILLFNTSIYSHAGELEDWLQAAAIVLVSHEGGHMIRAEESQGLSFTGSGLNYEVSQRPQPDPMLYPGASYSGGVVILPLPSYSLYQGNLSNWQGDSARIESSVAGGGWTGQQLAVERLPASQRSKSLLLSSLFKSGYVGYHYLFPGNHGDINRTVTAPASLVVSCLLVSSISDLIRASQPKPSSWSIGYFSSARYGGVGLQISGIF